MPGFQTGFQSVNYSRIFFLLLPQPGVLLGPRYLPDQIHAIAWRDHAWNAFFAFIELTVFVDREQIFRGLVILSELVEGMRIPDLLKRARFDVLFFGKLIFFLQVLWQIPKERAGRSKAFWVDENSRGG